MMRGYLTWRDNALCFASPANDYSAPTRTIQIWELERWPASTVDADLEGVETESYQNAVGTHEVRIPTGGSMSRTVRIGGSQKARETVVEDLPCPKVRKGTETRYLNGTWQKYLKTRGWVPC